MTRLRRGPRRRLLRFGRVGGGGRSLRPTAASAVPASSMSPAAGAFSMRVVLIVQLSSLLRGFTVRLGRGFPLATQRNPTWLVDVSTGCA